MEGVLEMLCRSREQAKEQVSGLTETEHVTQALG